MPVETDRTSADTWKIKRASCTASVDFDWMGSAKRILKPKDIPEGGGSRREVKSKV